MIEICKLCGHTLSNDNKGSSFARVNFTCSKCKQYSVVCLPNGTVETETLRSGNFYIIFIPAYKTASIVSTKDTDKKIFKSIEMEDFTAKDADYWNNKLKTYVLFQ